MALRWARQLGRNGMFRGRMGKAVRKRCGGCGVKRIGIACADERWGGRRRECPILRGVRLRSLGGVRPGIPVGGQPGIPVGRPGGVGAFATKLSRDLVQTG